MTDATYFRELVRSVVAGRPWLSAGDVLAPAAQRAEALLELGASRVFALGMSRGMGPLPDRSVVPWMHLDMRADDMMQSIRQSSAALAALPADMRDAVDAFDPERRAKVITPLWYLDPTIADRPVWGARPVAWQALEDKVTIDAFWDAARIERAPAVVVAPQAEALRGAFASLDEGLGVVVSADATEGFHGAAHGVRWMRDTDMAPALAALFAARSEAVRVMPFLEGIPCSIHGIVLPDRTLAVRPCEMVVLRKPGKAELHYAQAATFWDPPDADREAMRQIARRAGEQLRRQVGYRGVFTVDGVLSARGFLPTELNPRFGAAISILSRGLPELPLYLLHLAIADGAELDLRGDALERLLVASGDANRQGSGSVVTKRRIEESLERGMVLKDDAGWRWAVGDEPTDASFHLGPGPMGGYGKVVLEPKRTPVGESAAPRIASALMFVDGEYDLGLGPVVPAQSVR